MTTDFVPRVLLMWDRLYVSSILPQLQDFGLKDLSCLPYSEPLWRRLSPVGSPEEGRRIVPRSESVVCCNKP